VRAAPRKELSGLLADRQSATRDWN
jgi:hypothetical protein